jgi:PleD family two-component response regulator
MVANTLEKGLAGVKENSFDAILSDIGLPDGSGYVLMSEAKARDEKVIRGRQPPEMRKEYERITLSSFPGRLSAGLACSRLTCR